MKRIMLLLACILCLCAATAAADDATVTVTGSAMISVQPDQATVTLGVVTHGATAAAASQENAALLRQVLTALQTEGISEDDITTSNYSVNPDYAASADGKNSINGYQVSNMLEVRVRDVNQVGSVLDKALLAGANLSYGISYHSTKAQQASDEAMTAAYRDGMRKAELLAAAAGKKLGKLESVQESYTSYRGVTYKAEENADAAAGTVILPDGLSFSATLVLVFEME